MATDATGAPTSLGIPKIDPDVDAPSGLGTNAAMDSINTLLGARPAAPAGLVSGEAMVWNGTTWVRSSVTNVAPSSLGSGTPDATKFLRGDGTWAGSTMVQLFDSTLGAPDANFDITPISGAYTHLMLTLEGKMSGAVTLGSVAFTLNGDVGANYNWYGNKTSNTGGNAPNGVGGGTSAALSDGFFAGASSGAGAFSGADMLIRNYAGTTLRKSYNARATGQDAATVIGSWVGGGGWTSTAAITRITLTPSSGSFITGSRCTLYGIL